MNPQDYIWQKAPTTNSSFYYAFLFLPQQHRAAVTSFYVFFREIHNVVDEVKDSHVAANKLTWWQTEVHHTFEGKPSHPITQALMPWIRKYDIEEVLLQSIIKACEMDLTQTRYLDYPNLVRYCYLVAGTVSEVFTRIFDQHNARTTLYAHTLGQAIQLTKIIRDVGEDALLGRIYLPVTELQQFDVKAHEILNRIDSERFQALIKFQAMRAHTLYNEALALLPTCDWKHQKPNLIMASIYRSLLREIEAKRFPILKERVVLTPLHKTWLAWKMQALGRF